MPTDDSQRHRASNGAKGGISVTIRDDPTKLRTPVKAIVDLVREYEVILGTGHLSPGEIVSLLRFCRPLGVKILVTHPELPTLPMGIPVLREMLEWDAIFEICCVSTTTVFGERRLSIDSVIEHIRAIGPRSIVLSSDLGIATGPEPFVGMANFLDALEKSGVTPEDLSLMTEKNPRRLLEERHGLSTRF